MYLCVIFSIYIIVKNLKFGAIARVTVITVQWPQRAGVSSVPLPFVTVTKGGNDEYTWCADVLSAKNLHLGHCRSNTGFSGSESV